MAFKDLRNLHPINRDDGLIDDDKFTIFYDLNYFILEAFSSSCSFCFCFEFKIVKRSPSALDLQVTLNFGY